MAFFTPRGPDASFANLFRLLDDFDSYSRETQGSKPGNNRDHHQRGTPVTRTFTPRFDVRETETAFELHGELPGATRDQIQIEFIDEHGITVRGRIERAYTNNNHANDNKAIEGDKSSTDGEANKDGQQQVSKRGDNHTSSNTVDKLWLAERSIGEFSRSFTFPARLDSDAVSASLDKGILSIVIPKAKKMEARRIAIQ